MKHPITLHGRAPRPSLPYGEMKNIILGQQYELSLGFIGKKKAKIINFQTRQKTYAPNVLSFPYTPKCGDIVICPAVAKTEAADFNLSVDGYIGFLFIHGLLHLKGLDHGTQMSRLEKQYLKKFKLV